MTKTTNDKIDNIIVLRGVAALGVCLVHAQLLTGFKSIVDIVNQVLNQGQLGVQIFFIISGFILPLSLHKNKYNYTNFFRFIFKRSLRIDPPFWITIFLSLIVFNELIHFKFSNLFYNMFYLVPFANNGKWYNDVFWTLGIEFQFYIILGLCFPILEKISNYSSLLILVICFYLSLFNQFGQSRSFIIDNIGFFIIGYICYLTYIKKIRYDIGLSIVIALCISYGLVIANRYGLISIFTILLILVAKPIPFSLTKFLGGISYSLYLTHMLSIFIFVKLMSTLTNNTSTFLLSIIFCIPIAWLFNKYIEKPAMKLSKTIDYNPKIKS